MRVIALLSALVLVAGDDGNAPMFIEANEGNIVHMFIPPKTGHVIQECHIQDPKGEIFEFFPSDRLVDLSLVPSAISRHKDCAIDIRRSQVAHSGRWALMAVRRSSDGTVVDTKMAFSVFVKGNTNILGTRRFVLQGDAKVTISIPKKHEGYILKGCYLKDPKDDVVENIFESLNSALDECKFDFRAMEDHMYGTWTLHSSYESDGSYDQTLQPFFAVLEGGEINGNAELLTRINRAGTLGNRLSFSITDRRQDLVPNCFLTKPDGVEFNLINLGEEASSLDISVDPEGPTCNVVLDPLSHEMAGEWILVAVYDDDGEFHYIQPFTVGVGVIEVGTTVHTNDLDPRGFIVDVGGEFTVSVPYQNDYADGSCFLVNQDNVIIDLRPDNRNTVDNIQLLDGNTECAVTFKDVALDQAGEWALSSIFRSAPQDMQHYTQPFTIFLKGSVNTVPSFAVTIQQGENMYLRLRNPVAGLTNCRVDPPSADVAFETDTRFARHCGIVVQNVPAAAGGMWHVIATGASPANGVFQVEVTELELEDEPIKHILQHHQTTLSFGPPSAVYCDARDGDGTVHFRGFGPCLVGLERAGLVHAGTWSVSVGLPGRMALLQRTYQVRVIETVYDVVSSYVSPETATVPTSLNCRMWTTAEVRSCVFRRPDGQIFMMHDGVASNRYSFYGEGTEDAAVGVMTSCGISISSMSREDVGTWQCLIETSERTNTGFMTVHDETGQTGHFVSISTSDPVRTTAGSRVRLACSIKAPIRYCLFRHPNGTIISPLYVAEDFSYEFGDDGTRVDAGECAMQIFSANVSHSGTWQCILGTAGSLGGQSDFTSGIPVHVYASALVLQTEGRQETRGLLMEASTYDQSAVEYCRYIRPDGLSFNEKSNIPVNEYVLWNTNIDLGICSLVIQSTRQLDVGEWMIAVKRVGHLREDMVRVDLRLVSAVSGMSIWVMMLSIIALTLLFLSCMGLCMNRRHPGWVHQKTVFMRNSFKRKQPPQTVTANGP